MADERVERNKANWRRFQLEMIEEQKLELVPELMAPELTVHRWSQPPEVMTREEFARNFSRAPRPDDHGRTFEAIHGEGDFVWARWAVSFTHTLPWIGVPPTGRKVKHYEWANVRFDDQGRVAEFWLMADRMDCIDQLGATVRIEPPGDQQS